MNSIEINNLKVVLGDQTILEHVNMTIPEGKITTIVGVNGSGKSTLVKAICKLIKPKEGQIFLGNNPVQKMNQKQVAKYVAYLSQRNHNPDDITVEELVRYGRYCHKKILDRPDISHELIIQDSMKLTGILPFKDRRVSTLSGGESQRAWIAMSLAQKPAVLILDEPTTFLDIYHQLEVLQLMKKLNEEIGMTVIMVLHDINQAVHYSDHLVVLHQKKVFAHGTPSEVVTKDLIKEVFKINSKITKASDGWHCQVLHKT